MELPRLGPRMVRMSRFAKFFVAQLQPQRRRVLHTAGRARTFQIVWREGSLYSTLKGSGSQSNTSNNILSWFMEPQSSNMQYTDPLGEVLLGLLMKRAPRMHAKVVRSPMQGCQRSDFESLDPAGPFLA